MKETRLFADAIEVRDAGDGAVTIAGYAATFDQPYEVMGFTESVDPKAFNRTLKNSAADLAVVWSHNTDMVLGTVASGSARFSVDERGLKYEADLDLADPDGLSAYRKISTGKVRQSSFSFSVVKDAWEERDDAPPHRTLKEVKLYEASPTLWGANPSTEVDVKRATQSYAEFRGVDAGDDADITTIREATTPDPEPDPVSEPTQDSEPKRSPAPFHIGGLC